MLSMPPFLEGVSLFTLDDDGEIALRSETKHNLEVTRGERSVTVSLFAMSAMVYQFSISPTTEWASMGSKTFFLRLNNASIQLRFSTIADMSKFHSFIKSALSDKRSRDSSQIEVKTNSTESDLLVNSFDKRTDEASAVQYFQFYGYLSQQQNMMQDFIRTSTYQRAMISNGIDFTDKVVIDVGAGSGILSFFAIQAGARRVYAIEASSMAQHCETIVAQNKLSGKIIVVPGKVEEVTIPEQADVIVSEPMGYMLYNERMLETFLHAKKWLKPSGGKMYPAQGDLYAAPFSDESLYQEQFGKANFWYQTAFHGVDLSSLREAALYEYFRQPVVDTFDYRILMAQPCKHPCNFETADETDLHRIEFPMNFVCLQTGSVHGVAFWFDVAFRGSRETIWLSTAPTEPLTHWYQVRCLLRTPLFVKSGNTLSGFVKLTSNSRQSYDVDLALKVNETGLGSVNALDLKNPLFRYTGQPPAPPAGSYSVAPTEAFWASLTENGDANSSSQIPMPGLPLPVPGVASTTQGITNGVGSITMNPNHQQSQYNTLTSAPLYDIPSTITSSQAFVPPILPQVLQ